MSTRPYNLTTDSGGLIPVAQLETAAGTQTRPMKGTDTGDQWVHARDGEIVSLGAVADDKEINPDAAEATALQLLRGLLDRLIAVEGLNDRWDAAKDLSGLLGVVEIEHSKVHAGRGYKFQKAFSLTDTTAQRLHLKTGDDFIHLKRFSSSANNDEITIELYEDAVIDFQGTNEIPVLNSNRNSAFEPSLDVFDDTTYTGDGTLLEEYYLPGADGGETSDAWEWVLKPDSDYMIKVARLDGTGTTRVLTKFKFYEVDGPEI